MTIVNNLVYPIQENVCVCVYKYRHTFLLLQTVFHVNNIYLHYIYFFSLKFFYDRMSLELKISACSL